MKKTVKKSKSVKIDKSGFGFSNIAETAETTKQLDKEFPLLSEFVESSKYYLYIAAGFTFGSNATNNEKRKMLHGLVNAINALDQSEVEY